MKYTLGNALKICLKELAGFRERFKRLVEKKMVQKIGEITLNHVIRGIYKLPDRAAKVLIEMNVLKQRRRVIDGRERSFELEEY